MKNIIGTILSKILPVSYEYIPLFIHGHAPEFYRLLNCDDKSEAIELFNKLPPSSRCLLIESVSDTIQQDDFFDVFFDNSNGPALACLLRGALLLKRAWIYRGYGRGEELSEDQVDNMVNALKNSIRSFEPIMDDAFVGQEACARAIRTLMGLSDSWEEIDFVYGKMHVFPGEHMLGELNYLVASCEKWLGSHDKMFAHARTRVSAASKNPEMGALLAAAYWERHMFIERFEEDDAKALAFRSNAAIISEVKALADKLLAVSQPNCYDHIIGHNIFAAFFCEMNRFDLARPHFYFMGSKVIRYPWEFFGDGDLQKMYNKSIRSK